MPFTHLATSLLKTPRPAKRVLVLSLDIALCVFATWLAFYLRLDVSIPLLGEGYRLWESAVASLILAIPLFIVHGFYRVIFRHSGTAAVLTMIRAFLLYLVFYALIVVVLRLPNVPRSIGILQPLLLFVMVAASRGAARYWLGGMYLMHLRRGALPKVLIYGAGQAGRELARAMGNNQEMLVIGFLDDDDRLHGQVLNELPIYSPADLSGLVLTKEVSLVLLAMPSLGRVRRNDIISAMRQVKVAIRTLPSVTELAQGKVDPLSLRELDINDLLGREPVLPHYALLAKNVTDQGVLVTGAGGSIGSELCRQILSLRPKYLLLLEQSEFALYVIHQELMGKLSESPVIPLLGSVRDAARIHEIMATWQPNTVYHAAAYKHVPLVEHNPVEGILNNVFGTLTVARAAVATQVRHFVLISTDKAVRPTNIMGASKRLAEMVLQAQAALNSQTHFTMVRFGNVLGSSGSVVPKFREQIRAGGPVTVTHQEVTRYFMTIPEAAQLVIQAGAMGKAEAGGEVFLLDMGEPVRIVDLALRMIELSGLSLKDAHHPEGDIEIAITGMRPGEKLYEELLIGDQPEKTSHPRIMKANESFLPWHVLEEKLAALQLILETGDVEAMRGLLKVLVSGYVPNEQIVDWITMAQEEEEELVSS